MACLAFGIGRDSRIKLSSAPWVCYRKRLPLKRLAVCGGLAVIGIFLGFINHFLWSGVVLTISIYAFIINFPIPGIYSFIYSEELGIDSLSVFYKKKELKLSYHKDVYGKFVWDDLVNPQDCISFKSGEKMNKIVIPYQAILAVSDFLYKHNLLSDEML